MTQSDQQRRYKADALVLAAIGKQLPSADGVDVRLPKDLADAAVAAWKRDELESAEHEDELQLLDRAAAASLALIGLEICQRGESDGEIVSVTLDPDLVSQAIRAAGDWGPSSPDA